MIIHSSTWIRPFISVHEFDMDDHLPQVALILFISVHVARTHTATHCNNVILQHTATHHDNTIRQHTATHCNKKRLQHIAATSYIVLQHNANVKLHYNSLQHTATTKRLQHIATTSYIVLQHNANIKITPQLTTTHHNNIVRHAHILQHTATMWYCNILQHIMTTPFGNILQHTAVHCNSIYRQAYVGS